jgi:hypothetical protein
METHTGLTYLLDIFFIALGLLMPTALLVRWFKVRRARNRLQNSDTQEQLIGTEADLRDAEETLRFSPLENRDRLLHTHRLIERFSWQHGHTRTSVWDLAQKFHERGIEVEVIEQASLPPGAGAYLLEMQGIFEIYAPREQAEDAIKILGELYKK